MNRKGFTLIEIIICISMIVLIGVGSFVGISLVNKNLVKKGLEQITDKAVKATQVYIETNEEAKTQLYTEKNAIKIPIKVLINEGLLSLKGTNLSDKDIKNKYTITALSTSTGNKKDCIDINTKTSWDDSTAIYICTYSKSDDGSGGNENTVVEKLISINSNQYTAKGANPNNWIIFNELSKKIRSDYDEEYNFKFRIVSIDNGNVSLIPFMESNYYIKNGKGYCKNISNTANNQRALSDLGSCMYGFNFEFLNNCFVKMNGIKYNYVNNIVKYNITETSQHYNSRIMLYNEVLNTLGNDNESWLQKDMFLGFIKSSNYDRSFVYDDSNNYYLYPIFTLNLSEKVNIVEDDCSINENKVAGTKDCPYKVEIKDNYCGLD